MMNKDKWFTAKELTDWILNAKGLRLGKYGQGMTSTRMSYILKQRLFNDVETKKQSNNSKMYRWSG